MAKKKKVASYPKTSIAKDGYEMHYGHEIQEMMEKHMYKGAGRRHPSDDLNYNYHKPADEPFDVCAKKDAVKAFHRSGLGPKSGADNDKESMMYAREMRIGKKKKK